MANEPVLPNGAAPLSPEPTPAAEPQPSLREIAEQSWDNIEADVSRETSEPSADAAGRLRDEHGRFTSSQPGEQPADDKTPAGPAPDQGQEAQSRPAPVPGSSSEAPQHWPAEDREMYAKLPVEAKAFLDRRYGEMERDYTAKTQANATAVQFAQSVAPVFNDPQVQQSMVAIDGTPISPVHAIREWAAMHLRAMDPDPRVRAGFLIDVAQRLQLDPAAVFGFNRQDDTPIPGITDADRQHPAFRHLTDQLRQQQAATEALRNNLQLMQANSARAREQEAVQTSRQGVDRFADEKDQAGNLVHPHFDTVLPQILELFTANPSRDLAEAYETAIWMSPQLRGTLVQQQRDSVTRQADTARAAQAARMNTRGRTSPVSKPDDANSPKGLRATIAAAADEVGL